MQSLLYEWATILILPFHLICVNIASVGPLVCVWLDSRAARQCAEAKQAAQWLVWKSFQLSLVGAVLGLVIGGIRWLEWQSKQESYAAVLRPFASRLEWGVAEYAFSALLIAGYGVWLSRRPESGMGERWLRSFIALLAATNLLYHFPPLFTLIGKASAGQQVATGAVSSAMFRKLIVSDEVPAVTVHFLLASFAVAGGALMYRHWRIAPTNPLRMGIWGGRIALVATLLQIPVGVWLTMSVPTAAQQALLLGNPLLSCLFVVSLLGVMAMLHQLAAVAFGDASPRTLSHAIFTMLAVVVLMTAVLRILYW